MKLFEIRNAIAESYGDHWNVIHGPLFNYNLGNTNEFATVFGWHHMRAVLHDDVRIAVEVGMDAGITSSRDWKPGWASGFPDPSVSQTYIDVLFNGSLVDRESAGYVDGSRAVLPIPSSRDGELVVMDWPYQLARLIDDIEGRREFVDYFDRAGMKKWPA